MQKTAIFYSILLKGVLLEDAYLEHDVLDVLEVELELGLQTLEVDRVVDILVQEQVALEGGDLDLSHEGLVSE